MDGTQMTEQNGNSEQEFEYIELEEGQELPEGYEYEYIEVPADEVSEMDVVNRPHAFSEITNDEDDLASVSEIDATLQSSQQEEIRNEAPFPSFLQAGYDEQENISTINDAQNVTSQQENNTVNVNDVGTTNPEVSVSKNSNPDSEWQPQIGNVSPVDNASAENIHFLNLPEDNENWQEDTRASYDLDEVTVEDHNLQYKKNDVSSVDVNDYIEPEATYTAADVAVTEVPNFQNRPVSHVKVADVSENVQAAQPANSISNASHQEQDFELLNEDEKDVSLDELLQDDGGTEVPLGNMLDDNPINVASDVSATEEHIEEPLLGKSIEESNTSEQIMPQISEPISEPFINNSTQENISFENIEATPVEEIVSPVEEVVDVDDTQSIVPQFSEDVSNDDNALQVEQSQQAETVFVSENHVENAPVNSENQEPVKSIERPIEQPIVQPEVDNTVSIPEIVPQVSDNISTANESYENSTAALPIKEAIDVQESQESLSPKSVDIEEKKVQQRNEQPILVRSEDKTEEINPLPIMFDVVDYTKEDIAHAEFHSRLVSKQNGIQSFRADNDISDILLSDVDFSQNELKSWNLILYQQSIRPLEQKVAELSLPQQPMINRYIGVVQGGNKKFDLYNEENLKIINASNACVAVQGRFICGDFETNSGVIIDDFMPISLVDFAGKKISFKTPASGLLTGPNGCVLFFFGVKNLWLPSTEITEIDEQKLQYKISKWYSGTLNDKYFEFSAQSESSEFVGNEDMKAIHVNISNSSYGWNVTFDNGLSMNLRDLREYQTRFGKIPSANGIISYGQKTLKFQNVEKIVVYEAVQYFFYS